MKPMFLIAQSHNRTNAQTKKIFSILVLLISFQLLFAQQVTRTYIGQVGGSDQNGIVHLVNDVQITGVTGVSTYNVLSGLAPNNSSTCYAGVYNGKNGVFKIDYTAISGSAQVFNLANIQRNTNWLEGVSTLDLVLLSKHIANIALIPSPWKIISGDVYKDGVLTVMSSADISSTSIPYSTKAKADNFLIQQIILGVLTNPATIIQPSNTLPGVRSWYFVPEDLFFTSGFQTQFNNNPLSTTVPSRTRPAEYALPFEHIGGTLSYAFNLSQPCFGQNISAIKMGDISGNVFANYPLSKIQSSSNFNLFSFNKDSDKQLKKGSIVDISFSVSEFYNILSAQFGMKFDETKLKSLGVSKNGKLIDGFQIGTKQANKGQIKASWYDDSNGKIKLMQWDDNTRLFTMKFEALEDIMDISELFSLSNTVLPLEILDENENNSNAEIHLNIEKSDYNNENNISISPNPILNNVNVSFYSDSKQTVFFSILNTIGQVLQTNKLEIEKGENTVNLDVSNLNPGIYFCSLGGIKKKRIKIIKK